jgi:hypothetical protein
MKKKSTDAMQLQQMPQKHERITTKMKIVIFEMVLQAGQTKSKTRQAIRFLFQLELPRPV